MTTATKTMTCRDLGGPCDLPLQGTTADEVIHAQDAHLKAADGSHAEALAAMKGRWRRPVSGLSWYRSVKKAFAALPQDQPQP